MNLSMKWLSDFVRVDVSPRVFSEAMTMSGSKVEGYKIEGSEISNVIVGKILEIEKHPDADSLVVCKIEVGIGEPIQIVTGATNIKTDDYVPVAMHGSTLPNGVKIKKGKLRGIESNGMLCSIGELNLTISDFPYALEDGIFILQEPCEVGNDIKHVLGINDVCVEFEITSNRPDCLSVTGLAREAAATFNLPFSLPPIKVKGSTQELPKELSVKIENSDFCTRYIAKVVKNVKIGPSPRFIRERLRASGVRPINNLVDITNYVMLELGHPMHAFDYDEVAGKAIIVRNANQDEKIRTLDGEEYTLTPEMLVIADTDKATAIAGIMGGKSSSITENTTTVLLESACFSGEIIRTTSKKLGVRSESSLRFEKGLHPDMAMATMMRACELIEELGIGEVLNGEIDVQTKEIERKKIPLDHNWINGFLGISLSKEEMLKIVKKLDFEWDDTCVIVPNFRIDIVDKADLAEEVARIYGYDKIPTTKLKGSANGVLTTRQKFTKTIAQTLVGLGLYEIITYSFISPKQYDKMNLPSTSKLRDSLVILNPLGEDTSIMRTTTIPSMLDVISKNINNRNLVGAFFEIGTTYTKTTPDELPLEQDILTMGIFGSEIDFYTLKGVVEKLLSTLFVGDISFHSVGDDTTFHPGRCASISCGEIQIGMIGQIHPTICENFDVSQCIFMATLEVDALMDNANREIIYKQLPKYPSSSRDLALVCEEEVPVASIEKIISNTIGTILDKIELFDIYKGSQLPENKKSVAYAITMRSAERTLTDEECDNAMNKT
ncbi:MAG: phenylalanine--tRNA ligase subunit beta, partial [Oscillospiraceae bacterium]